MSRYPRGFWTVWIAVAVDLLGFGIIIPLLPLYAESFGATPTVIGLLFASYSLAQFVFSPIWGRISDRWGRKPVLLITIAGSAIGSLVLGFAGSLLMLFIGRIIDGVSGASIAVARATVADTASSEERSRLMGMLGAAFGAGFVLGPALGSIAALGGESLPFFLAAAISTLNLVAAWFRLPETKGEAVEVADRPSISTLSNPAVRLVTLTFIGVTAFSAFEATLALLGNRRLGMSQSTVAAVFAGVGVVLVATQAGLVGPVSRRLGERGLIRLGLFLNVGGFALLSIAADWILLGLALVLLAVGQGLITPGLASAMSTVVPGQRVGTALGYQQSAGGLARVVGPVLGGVLFASGTGLPYLVAGLATLLVIPIVPLTPTGRVRPNLDSASI